MVSQGRHGKTHNLRNSRAASADWLGSSATRWVPCGDSLHVHDRAEQLAARLLCLIFKAPMSDSPSKAETVEGARLDAWLNYMGETGEEVKLRLRWAAPGWGCLWIRGGQEFIGLGGSAARAVKAALLDAGVSPDVIGVRLEG